MLKIYGRVLIRPSETEYFVRVMIEEVDKKDKNEKAEKIVNLIKQKYGA